jgi:sulfate permease, SulP family
VLARTCTRFNPWAALAIGLASLAVVVLWPKSYAMPVAPSAWGQGAALRRTCPGTVVALVGATLLVRCCKLPVETIGSASAASRRRCRRFALPEFSWATAKQLLIPTLTIALLGAIESLLCARVADNMTDCKRHDPNQELMAQGVANWCARCSAASRPPAPSRAPSPTCAPAPAPVAGIVHALTLLAVVLLAAPLAMHVPLAALAGILLFVAWNMGEWREFARLRQFSIQYRTILLGTFAADGDLRPHGGGGGRPGAGLRVLHLPHEHAVQRAAAAAPAGPLPDGVQVFELFGSLFFGAVGKIEALPAQLPAGTRAWCSTCTG